MLRAIIIDDELASLSAVSAQVKAHCPNVAVEALCDSVQAGLKAIYTFNPDLVFLDIEMPGMTGLEMLEQIPDFKFGVIFITAFNKYALSAIKLSALDYLLKPINPEELKAAVGKAEQKVARDKTTERYQMMLELLNGSGNQTTAQKQQHKIALPTFESIIYVPLKNILRIEAEQNYCKFFFRDGTSQLISKNIGTYDESLEPYGFMRVHRTHIANLHHVERYLKHDNYLLLTDGSKIEVSRQKKEMVLNRLKEL